MSHTPVIPLDPARCNELDAAWAMWAASPELEQVVQAVSQVHGYAAADTSLQLARVAQRCSASALRACADAEAKLLVARGEHIDASSAPAAPRRVLHLVASTVPGLVLESIAHTLALGADVVVRPSARECVLDPWLSLLRRSGSPLVDHMHIIDELPEPGSVDAVVIFGSDTTIARVRRMLALGEPSDHSQELRIAGYGTRRGIAIVDAPAIVDADRWVDLVADDVALFLQRGCMSPSTLLVRGPTSDSAFAGICERMHAALTKAWDRHRDPAWEMQEVTRRQVSDAATLNELFGSPITRPNDVRIQVGTLEVDCVHVASDTELEAALAQEHRHLQTAVIVATDQARMEQLAAIATHAGCSRTCSAGHAHAPQATWPHDGIGWFIPLLG